MEGLSVVLVLVFAIIVIDHNYHLTASKAIECI